MRRQLSCVILCAVSLIVASHALAQFGHPLKGSWSGDWGSNKAQRTRVLLQLQWDGKALSGAINPGPNAVTLTAATLEPGTWMVHLEGDGKDASGKTTHVAIDGKLENIGAYRRVLSGTWTQDGQKGDFRLVRN